nr:hypothetical protein [Actinomycetota bacterium]
MNATRLVLACYPPSFTERYGSELAAVTEDVGPGHGQLWDLARGAASAWCRPALPRTTPEGRR